MLYIPKPKAIEAYRWGGEEYPAYSGQWPDWLSYTVDVLGTVTFEDGRLKLKFYWQDIYANQGDYLVLDDMGYMMIMEARMFESLYLPLEGVVNSYLVEPAEGDEDALYDYLKLHTSRTPIKAGGYLKARLRKSDIERLHERTPACTVLLLEGDDRG